MSTRIRSRGVALPIVLGLIVLLGMLVVQLSSLSRSEARLTRMLAVDAEHLYRAEAVVAKQVNRLKKRPWPVRWYAEGPPGTGPWSGEDSGVYRDGTYVVWVQDVSAAGVAGVPGLVDLFVAMEYESTMRSFHYRLELLGGSGRRPRAVRIAYFARMGEDPTRAEGRLAAAARANADMRAAAKKGLGEAVLEALPESLRRALAGRGAGAGEVPEAGALAATLLGTSLEATAAARDKAREALARGIHLMGEDGDGLEELLPPMERGRFIHRAPASFEARAALEEALRLAGPDAALAVAARLGLARSFAAEAWKRGPASPAGRELLRKAAEALDPVAGVPLDAVDPSTLLAAALERARIARLAGDASAEEEALVRASRVAAGGKVYGGADPEAVIGEARAAWDSPAARVRARSSSPLPPSGFAPVSKAEVEGMIGDPDGGWADWPRDTGVPEATWVQIWEEELAREGEGAPVPPPPGSDVDRDGDGIPDPDANGGGPDQDGDGVADGVVEDTMRAGCDTRCGALAGPARDACDEDCMIDAVAAAGVPGPGGGISASVGVGIGVSQAGGTTTVSDLNRGCKRACMRAAASDGIQLSGLPALQECFRDCDGIGRVGGRDGDDRDGDDRDGDDRYDDDRDGDDRDGDDRDDDGGHGDDGHGDDGGRDGGRDG